MTAEALTPAAQRIVDAAAELFYQHGIAAVGVDTIAERSGITKRTLYNRFKSKDALVEAYLKQRHEQWLARWEARLAHTKKHRALTLFDSYLDIPKIDRGCAFINAAGELPISHPAFAMIRMHKHFVVQRLQEIIEEDLGSAQKSTTNAKGLAEHIFLLAEGAIAHRGIDNITDHMTRARAIAVALLKDTK